MRPNSEEELLAQRNMSVSKQATGPQAGKRLMTAYGAVRKDAPSEPSPSRLTRIERWITKWYETPEPLSHEA